MSLTRKIGPIAELQARQALRRHLIASGLTAADARRAVHKGSPLVTAALYDAIVHNPATRAGISQQTPDPGRTGSGGAGEASGGAESGTLAAQEGRPGLVSTSPGAEGAKCSAEERTDSQEAV